jgi:hypothetical protein
MESCIHCGSSNVAPWTGRRRMCKDCGKTFQVGQYDRPAVVEKRPDVTCPNCGETGRHVIVSKFRGRPVMCCKGCGKRFRADQNTKPDAVEDQVIVVTSAVNDSPVHRPFLATLRRYCADRNARLIVIPLRYKNPTRQGEGDGCQWDAKVAPFLCEKRLKVCKGLQILGDIKPSQPPSTPCPGWTR